VRNSKSKYQNPLNPFKAYKIDEQYDNSLLVSFEIIEQNITGYDKKFDGKNKTKNK
jgi:hypothetical protein